MPTNQASLWLNLARHSNCKYPRCRNTRCFSDYESGSLMVHSPEPVVSLFLKNAHLHQMKRLHVYTCLVTTSKSSRYMCFMSRMPSLHGDGLRTLLTPISRLHAPTLLLHEETATIRSSCRQDMLPLRTCRCAYACRSGCRCMHVICGFLF